MNDLVIDTYHGNIDDVRVDYFGIDPFDGDEKIQIHNEYE